MVFTDGKIPELSDSGIYCSVASYGDLKLINDAQGGIVLEVHQFTYGPLTPGLAFLAAVVGSTLGVQCSARARVRPHPFAWLCAAAVSLGGAGMWVMHFVAMLGFSITNVTIRYSIPLTLLSAAIGIAVVGAGLFVAGVRALGAAALPLGGAVTGCGLAAMHYTGMAAMSTDVVITYDPTMVAVSVAVAIVVATAALWVALRVEGLLATLGAAIVMAGAACGVHYAGMAALRAHVSYGPLTARGADPFTLLAPLILVVTVITAALLIIVGTTDNNVATENAAAADNAITTDNATHSSEKRERLAH
jgi:NO-binding membrane sensor protein with MHYT domain